MFLEVSVVMFFVQAEDGIRDIGVTGVQTCALPICLALAKHEIHLTLMRFNLGELDIVKNEAGQTNIFSLGVTLPDKKSSGAAAAEFKKQTGFEFKSIDVLNVSVSTAKYIDLKDQRNNRAQKIDIQNQVIKNVTSGADLAGLAVLVALR